MKKKYLIDVNLPYYFSIWNSEEYIHQKDINDEWDDDKIWKYAQENNLTIVSKDNDFSNRILFSEPPPRVIHIRVGNMKLNQLFTNLSAVWQQIKLLSDDYKLVNVFEKSIEGVN